jgi:predicted dehydrogenase
VVERAGTGKVPCAEASGGTGPRRVHRGVILGAGGIARSAHLPAFRDLRLRDRLCIAALVDPEQPAGSVDGIPLVSQRRSLREFEPIGFVDICTPTASHHELILWALSEGYHVLCEKPVALSLAEARAVAAAAERAHRLVVPCHQHRYNPVWLTVLSWLREERIGRWHLAEFQVHRAEADRGSPAAASGSPWRGDLRQGRGGVLLDHGTHLIYQILDAAGRPPESIQSWTGRLLHTGYTVEDTAHLLLHYPDRLASVFLTWAGRGRENRIRFIGSRGSIDWQGGILRLEQEGRVETIDFTAQLDKAVYAQWFARLFEDFADAMDLHEAGANAGATDLQEAGGSRAGAYLEDIARVAAVLEQAYRRAGA